MSPVFSLLKSQSSYNEQKGKMIESNFRNAIVTSKTTIRSEAISNK